MRTYRIQTSTGIWEIPRLKDGVVPSDLELGDDWFPQSILDVETWEIEQKISTLNNALDATSEEIYNYVTGEHNMYKRVASQPFEFKVRTGATIKLYYGEDFNGLDYNNTRHEYIGGSGTTAEPGIMYGVLPELYPINGGVESQRVKDLWMEIPEYGTGGAFFRFGWGVADFDPQGRANVPRKDSSGDYIRYSVFPPFVSLPIAYDTTYNGAPAVAMMFIRIAIPNLTTISSAIYNKPFTISNSQSGWGATFQGDFYDVEDHLGVDRILDVEAEEGGAGGCFVDVTERFSPRVHATGVGVYPLNKDQVTHFLQGLWTESIVDKMIKEINGDVTENIISLIWYYGIKNSITGAGGLAYLQLGNVAFNGEYFKEEIITEPSLSEFIQFDCGSINLIEQTQVFRNFMDYSPFTELQAHLPFIGWVPLDISDFLLTHIRLVYSINIVTGAAMAHLYSGDGISDTGWELIEEIPCSMGVEIPINYKARDGITSRMATAIGGGVLSSAALHPVTRPMAFGLGIDDMTGAIESPPSSSSGGFDSETSSLSCMKAYLKITRPVPVHPDDYNEVIGRPDYTRGKISEFSGYIKVGEITGSVDSINMHRDVYDEIENMLKEGVYLD